jgi:hypothetical protein
LDFELVFEYTTSEPKVHLYVKRFSIAWDKNRFKGPPQGRKVRKNAELYKLMLSASEMAKARETATADSAVDGNRSDDSIKSQDGEADGMNDSQTQFMSQMPPKRPGELIAGAVATGKMLLSSLIPSARPAQESQAKKNNETDAVALERNRLALEEATEQPNINGCAPPMDELPAGSLVVDPGQNGNATVKKSDQTDTDTAGVVPAKTRSGTAPLNTETEERALTDNSEEPEHPSNKEEVPSQIVQKRPSEQVDSVVETIPTDVHTSNADPWEGMTEIRKEDITIPKDQAKLLEEQARLCWLPPAPSQVSQPNVPPLLLQQWNDIALQRSLRAEKRRNKELESLELHESRPSSSGATSSSDSAYETPSGDPIEWSQSPRRGQDLPADSSPPEARPIQRPTMNKTNGGNSSLNQPLHDVQEERQANEHQEKSHEQEDLEPLPEAGRECPKSIALNTELRLRVSGESPPQLDEGDDRIQLQEPQVEFDRMSEDSVMDTSIPRPLGVDATQSEQEIGSSDPSLPGLSTQVQVQVMETPAAHLVRFRQLTQSTGGASQESQQPGQPSSPVAKSSSQSRICNTYRSNDEAKDHTSQDMSHSTQPHGTAESSEVNIMETQLSGGEWSFSGTTSSNSAHVLNSSGPRDREPSVFITASPGQGEESSKPFSSYREAPSFMQTDDGNETSTGFPSPTQVTTPRHRMPLLKRGASEIDMERTPPSKRQRTAYSEGGDFVQGLAFEVISRRESYINRSAEHAEAQKVYEKFRSDYPEYDGDFNHFTMLCSKLQALRAKGHFRRSFLWDDFVIMHLQEYESRYLNRIAEAADVKRLGYESFFASYILRPSYKKRSLTAKGIEISAAQHDPSSAAGVPAIPRHETNTSFTGSLVDRFSNFQAHSTGPETPRSRFAAIVDLTSSPSPTPLKSSSRDTSARSRRMVEAPLDTQPTPTKITRSHNPTPTSSFKGRADRLGLSSTPRSRRESHRHNSAESRRMAEEPLDMEPTPTKITRSHNTMLSSPSQAIEWSPTPSPRRELHRNTLEKRHRTVEEPHDTEVTPKVTRSHNLVHEIPKQANPSLASVSQVTPRVPPSPDVNRKDDDSRSIPETNPSNDEVEEDSMDETHEIASVELGDDGPSTAPAVDQSEAESDAVSEADSFDEDWVGWHCRRLQSTGPFWSDDPNTPFKVLARADANVRSELRRRGMARFPVDERGVIQPLVDYPPVVSLRDLLDGPSPSPEGPSSPRS